jgi:hypothetical protein
MNYELNVKRRVLPHQPKEWAVTTAELAESGNLKAQREIRQAEKAVNKVIDENQKLYQQYKDETDRRNAIVNRMAQLR